MKCPKQAVSISYLFVDVAEIVFCDKKLKNSIDREQL